MPPNRFNKKESLNTMNKATINIHYRSWCGFPLEKYQGVVLLDHTQ